MRFILVAEGTSDQALEPIIRWLLRQKLPISCTYDLQFIRKRVDLNIEIANAAEHSDIVIVHRDADGHGFQARLQEIQNAAGLFNFYVPLIPVRMMEAWLLFDEVAIRSAASNPKSRVDLQLPSKKIWETIADPKTALFESLIIATEYSGRKLRDFDKNAARARVAQLIQDFSPLRQLTGFQHFEAQLDQVLQTLRQGTNDAIGRITRIR
jgi:hypothetical protein